jgi:hypothetical protein
MATPSRSRTATALVAMFSAFVLAGIPGAAGKPSPKKPAAAAEPPMQVYIVRSAQEGCEPNCPEWIAAQGQIQAGSPEKFRRVLAQLGKRRLPVLIHSGGGLADEGLEIGRMLRAKGLDVAVGKTLFTPCAPEAAACRKKQGKQPLRGSVDPGFSLCASSCVFVLAAGARRYVGLSALVGVHRVAMIRTKVLYTYRVTPYRADNGAVRYRRKLIGEKVVSQRKTAAPEKTYNKYEKYFVAMGVEKDIMPLMLAAANSSIRWLSRDELRATRVATHRMDGQQLVLGAIAKDDGWSNGPAAPAAPGAPRVPAARKDCGRFGGVDLGCSVQGVPGTSYEILDAPPVPVR